MRLRRVKYPRVWGIFILHLRQPNISQCDSSPPYFAKQNISLQTKNEQNQKRSCSILFLPPGVYRNTAGDMTEEPGEVTDFPNTF